MINYTDHIARLMGDIVAKVEPLSFIDLSELLVFARLGRAGAEGAYATCHSLTLPTSEPGYYFWRDRVSGRMTRRSEWFVTKTPEVVLRARPVNYLISFSLPRFCNQTLEGARKQVHYPGAEPWIAKLDTIVHELYHIDPEDCGIRRMERTDGNGSSGCHSPEFFEDVARFVRLYLKSDPDPAILDFLAHDFAALEALHGGVTGTTFRNYPSFPQRYEEPLRVQPVAPRVAVVPLKRISQPMRYTETDLRVRRFTNRGSRMPHAEPSHRAA